MLSEAIIWRRDRMALITASRNSSSLVSCLSVSCFMSQCFMFLTCCSKHQRGEMLRRGLQGGRSAQSLRLHGGEDAVEARQRPGLNPLHPAEQRRRRRGGGRREEERRGRGGGEGEEEQEEERRRGREEERL
ncbi:hypothetical protein EYF80_059944 [Liparis tanakae]|uniref:Uncharacterized protein n=1 Tax=Liparis tanakae TaxID=230148 RepID=A0A4Z2ELY5_9TELE|nr:hypothetical protein EYF80_059944 [Liparis tanakae]